MNESEFIEKWNDELFLSKAQFEVGKKILETIEREFDYDASFIDDEEWNELVFCVISETEGMTTDVDKSICRVFAEIANDWSDESYYGIDPTAIKKWLRECE